MCEELKMYFSHVMVFTVGGPFFSEDTVSRRAREFQSVGVSHVSDTGLL